MNNKNKQNNNKEFIKTILESDFKDIIGQEEAKKQIKSTLITNRHILIIGPPGVGKTTIAKNVSKLLPEIEVMNCPYHCLPEKPICPFCKSGKTKGKKRLKGIDRFVRVQGSPDLTVEDLIGDIDPIKAMKFGPSSIEAFTPGKIFKANNGILFFDEINRCPEKVQNALLQVLSEGKVTIGSYDIDIESNFILIATMNPEDKSTEPLSDVLLDRFDVVYMSYPEDLEKEIKIVKMKGKKYDIVFPDDVLKNTIIFVRELRQDENIEKMPSVRASIGLYERAQSNALIRKSNKVDYQDIYDAIISVLSYRIRLKPSIRYLKTIQDYLKEKIDDFIEKNKLPKNKIKGDYL